MKLKIQKILEFILTEKGRLRVFFQWCSIFILLGIFVKFSFVITTKRYVQVLLD